MTIVETIEIVETNPTFDCLHSADGHALRAGERYVYFRGPGWKTGNSPEGTEGPNGGR
jgi:hypothetical protein